MLDLSHLPKTAALLQPKPPEMLYHYTSGYPVQSIIETGELWAGLPEQMNDAEELFRALGVVSLIAGRHRLDAEVSKDRKPKRYLFDKWIDLQFEERRLKRMWLADKPKSYIVSLSAQGDSLSQWRAYCPQSGGYCVGLPSDLVVTAAKGSRAILAPVIYDDDDVRAVVAEIYDYHLNKWQSEDTNPEIPGTTVHEIERYMNASTAGIEAAFAGFLDEIRLIAHFIKNPSFYAEEEWRILIFDRQTVSDDLKYAHTDTGIKAFLPFDFLAGHKRDWPTTPRPSLRIGPNRDPEGAVFASTRLFEKLVGAGNADVWKTGSSYR